MRNLLYFGLLLALFSSCKEKETSTPEDPGIVHAYLPMKTGNYWVYKHFNIDTLGQATATDRTDSVVITGDTMINAKQYFVFAGTNYPYNPNWGIINFLRDSSGYIVDSRGTIFFSEKNFTDTLAQKTEVIGSDTLYSIYYRMEKPDQTITVPAGVFGTLNFKGTVHTKTIPGIPNPRFMNNYYADNVGKIIETYIFINNPTFSEKRLVRYKTE